MVSLPIPDNPHIIRQLIIDKQADLTYCRTTYAQILGIGMISSSPEKYSELLTYLADYAELIKQDIREIQDGSYNLELPN